MSTFPLIQPPTHVLDYNGPKPYGMSESGWEFLKKQHQLLLDNNPEYKAKMYRDEQAVKLKIPPETITLPKIEDIPTEWKYTVPKHEGVKYSTDTGIRVDNEFAGTEGWDPAETKTALVMSLLGAGILIIILGIYWKILKK